MGTFLDDLVKKMKTAPHAGLSPVTNPKMPTKVSIFVNPFALKFWKK